MSDDREKKESSIREIEAGIRGLNLEEKELLIRISARQDFLAEQIVRERERQNKLPCRSDNPKTNPLHRIPVLEASVKKVSATVAIVVSLACTVVLKLLFGK